MKSKQIFERKKTAKAMPESASLKADPEGKNGDLQWIAKWIGVPPESECREPFIYARKAFTLNRLPAAATVHISACPSYKLYINGLFIGDGPPRTVNPAYAYFSYEVGDLLQPGSNVISVIYGADIGPLLRGSIQRPSVQDVIASGRFEGIIVQMEMHDVEGRLVDRVISDSSWKTAPGPWKYTGAVTAAHQSTEVFDARNDAQGWMTAFFDDSSWSAAFSLGAADGKPVPNTSAGSTLEPAAIPPYERNSIFPSKIEAVKEVLNFSGETAVSAGIQMAMEIPREPMCSQVENVDALLGDNPEPTTVSPRFDFSDNAAFYRYWDACDDAPEICDPTIILNFGSIRNAFISFDVEGPSGAIIDIAWGQKLIDGRVPSMLYCVDPRWDGEGKPKFLFAHRYMLREGRQRWESYNWQNFRFLQLTFRRMNGPLKLYGVHAIASGLSWSQKGRFRCSDPQLERFFEMSANTLRACSYDTFMDNTIREKIIWGGDVADGSVPLCIPLYGDCPALRNYLTLFCRSQSEDGDIPPRVTGAPPPFINDYRAHSYRTAYWIAEYAFWCDDQEYYRREMWPVVVRFLDFAATQSDEYGILRQDSWRSLYVDWASGQMIPDEASPVSMKGSISLTINLLYVALLKKAVQVGEGMGEHARLGRWEAVCEHIAETAYDLFWDEAAGLYVDGIRDGYRCGSFTEHANWLALRHGLGKNGRESRILERLRASPEQAKVAQCGPPFMFHLLDAMFAVGGTDYALNTLSSRYSRFVRAGFDTFCESWTWCGAHYQQLISSSWSSSYSSVAQCGAGSPAFHLVQEILGVRPKKPGFSEFTVAPRSAGLCWAEGVVPSPRGEIVVHWEKDGDELSIQGRIPPDSCADIVFADKTHRIRAGGQSQVFKLTGAVS